MKKSNLVLLISILTAGSVSAQDLSTFGLQGKVLSTSASQSGEALTFSKSGNLTDCYFESNEANSNIRFTISDTPNASTVTGTVRVGYSSYDATLTLTKGLITSMTYTDYDSHKFTYTFTYNKQGLPAEISLKETWSTTSVTHIGPDASLSDWQKKVQEFKKFLDNPYISKIDKAKYQKLYDEAVKKVAALKGTAKDVKNTQQHSDTKCTKKFSDYQFDEHGNWISRSVNVTDFIGSFYTQTRTIEYEPEFLSEYLWSKLEASGNLNDIRSFIISASTTRTYKEIATDYWCSHVWPGIEEGGNLKKIEEFYSDYVVNDEYKGKAAKTWNAKVLDWAEKEHQNDADLLCQIASNPMASQLTSDRALAIAREKIYNDRVLPERDFAKLEKLANAKDRQMAIFDTNYRNKILQLAATYKADSIKNLLQGAEDMLAMKQYITADERALDVIMIDPSNLMAKQLRAEAQYQILQGKVVGKYVTEDDYTEYLNHNPESKYFSQVQDDRALFAARALEGHPSEEGIKRVRALPCSTATSEKVRKMTEHQRFLMYRGRFCRIGIGGEVGFGANTIMAGEVSMRLGYVCNYINLFVGAKYNTMDGTIWDTKPQGYSSTSSVEKTGGGLATSYLSVPVVLRINVDRDYESSIYVGLGADINLTTFDAKYKTDDFKIKDKNLALKQTSISPRLSLGMNLDNFELEAFINFDLKDTFDKDYIDNTFPEGIHDMTYGELMGKSHYKNQVSSMSSFRGGLALRIMF